MSEDSQNARSEVDPRDQEIARRKAAAEARQAEAAARKAEIEAVMARLPDLEKVKASTLEVSKEGPAIGASTLTFGAVAEAAQAIADEIGPLASGSRVLVTSHDDLASSDSLYYEVESGLAQLVKAADELLLLTTDGSEGGVETASLELVGG